MLIALLTLAFAAQASPSTAPAQQVQPAKICREEQRQTGSHIRPGHVCKTQEQWRMDDEARDRIPLRMQIKGEETTVRPH